jgi:hypothetical protein
MRKGFYRGIFDQFVCKGHTERFHSGHSQGMSFCGELNFHIFDTPDAE